MMLVAAAPAAEPRSTRSIADFADLDLEDLANMSVTSVGKKEQKLNAAPAAIYVLTEEDVRRSGTTSIPEALRLVPGLEVARVDSSQLGDQRPWLQRHLRQQTARADGWTQRLYPIADIIMFAAQNEAVDATCLEITGGLISNGLAK